MRDLVKLKQDVIKYCERHESQGNKVANYNCPNCNGGLKTIIPNEEGEVWDTATTCYECGEVHWVIKTISGVEASKMEG